MFALFSLQTCQRLVELTPCSSDALTRLGNVQLSQFDSDPDASGADGMIKDAVASFRASIELEGKAAAGEPPALLKGRLLLISYAPPINYNDALTGHQRHKLKL